MNLTVRNRSETLVTDDHTSEGFIVNLSNGDILHIFRFDIGIEGDHTGNNGYIAKRRYSNGVWGATETVYDSGQYDDRNIHGGVTNDGRIVVFFRRFDDDTGITEGHYFIYSDNDGATWSNLNLMNTNGRTMVYGTGQMFYNPEIQKYCIAGYDKWYCEMRFSSDGSNWDEHTQVATADGLYTLSEVAGAYCGNGRMIVLIRDDKRALGFPLVQVTSTDNGKTWNTITSSNIPSNNFWGCAPQLLYDAHFDILIAMTNDRRSYHGGSKAEESLYIFHANPDDIFTDSRNWTLGASFVRPKTDSSHDFYGYPTYAKVDDNKYFIVYTDRDKDGGGESAHLYQFELLLNHEFLELSKSVYEVVPFKVTDIGLVELEVYENRKGFLTKIIPLVSK